MSFYLPQPVVPDDVEKTIGLISDTHIPQRWPCLPTAVIRVFASCDLILHAGDVGELRVLDQLSQIAPVIAVHGNDDTAESQRELPYQQVVTINQRRILLWHSHYPNRVDEMHARRADDLREGCIRSVSRAKSAGASVVVFGHWHIPLVFEQDGITAVNPGAFASGNLFTMQTIQTVALLFLLKDGTSCITHVDVAQPERPFTPPTDLNDGFLRNMERYSRSILNAELETLKNEQLHTFKRFFAIDAASFLDAFLPAARQVWSGQKQHLGFADLKSAIETADIKESIRAQFMEGVNEMKKSMK